MRDSCGTSATAGWTMCVIQSASSPQLCCHICFFLSWTCMFVQEAHYAHGTPAPAARLRLNRTLRGSGGLSCCNAVLATTRCFALTSCPCTASRMTFATWPHSSRKKLSKNQLKPCTGPVGGDRGSESNGCRGTRTILRKPVLLPGAAEVVGAAVSLSCKAAS